MSDVVAAIIAAAIGLVFAAVFARMEWMRRALERAGATAKGRVSAGSSHRSPSSMVSFNDGAGRAHRLLVMSSFARGTEVEVRYDPERPSRAFLTRQRWSHAWWLLGTALMLGLSGSFVDLW
jgi:hypothetical protein